MSSSRARGSSTAERTLSPRELNRALLARQLLLERSQLPITKALERIAGLQTQYAPSAYVSLWSRLDGFRRDQLTEALVRRRAIQATLMRATIHVVSARDFPLLASAIRTGRQVWWRRGQRRALDRIDMLKVAARVRHHLAQGPRRAAELQQLLQEDGYPRIAAVSAGMWVDIVRVPPSGTWDQRRADLYGLAEHWLGSTQVAEATGLELLVRRYLGGFGPASLNDLVSWTGLPVATLRPVLARLRLRRMEDERGGELLDLPGAPLPHPDTPAPVRFLPTWDATLLVHARRTGILPEVYRPRVFHVKTPHSVATFLVDGSVMGTWRYEKGRVKIEPFCRLKPATRREVEHEAEKLAAFHGPE